MGPQAVSFVERLSSFRGSQCIETIGRVICGTSSSVLCREVPISVGPLSEVQPYDNIKHTG